MFEFLITQSNTENPTAISITITVLFSFFLSSLIVITYEYTTKGVQRPMHFLQSMVLISIVAATVMQAIGDSLARGLGMLGALAIIRFRTVLNNPRNMSFMFAALATGIACGVFGFTIAFVGTIGFCLAAIILRFSPFNTDQLVGTLKIEVPLESQVEEEIEAIIKRYASRSELTQIRFLNLRKTEKTKDLEGNIISEMPMEHIKELNYLLSLKSDTQRAQFTADLEQLPDIRDLRLRFGQESINL